MNWKTAVNILKGTASEFSKDNVLRLSAALAYYAMFSIGPLLAIVVGLAGLAFGKGGVQQQIHQTLQGMVGENAAKTVDSMMAARQHGTSLLTTIIGGVALLFGAAGVFGQLQDSLNTIWGVKAKPGAGVWAFIRNRFLSLSMVLGIGFLLLISLALSTGLAAFTGTLNRMIPMGDVIAHAVDFVVSFGVVTLLFAMIFKFLPDVKIPWSKVWAGAIVTALLFVLGKYLLGLYLGKQSTASAYGAAGSVIVILLWIYYASVILLSGAEFTQIYARHTGANVKPAKYAVPVTAEERKEQGMSGDNTGSKEPQPVPALVLRGKDRGAASESSEQLPGKTLYGNAPGPILLMLATSLMAGVLLGLKAFRKPPARHEDLDTAKANPAAK
jgi:membrane protein